MDTFWESLPFGRTCVISFVFFSIVYLVGYYLVFRKWLGRERAEAASCLISLAHGTTTVALTASYFFDYPWRLAAPNSDRQVRIMEFSIAYFVLDLVHLFVAAPDDVLFIAHHVATLLYMFTCIAYGHGAVSVMVLVAAGEATSPVQNVYTLAKMARTWSTTGAAVYRAILVPFTIFYSLLRGVLGPWIIVQLVLFYSSGAADAVLPRWVANLWMGITVLAVTGSFVWVLELWNGIVKSLLAQQPPAAKKSA
eukprot:jgi/Mesen1/1081/ME000123S00256